MLFNIHTLSWDEDICRWLNIPMGMLPTPVGNSEIYGESAAEFLGGSIRIAGAAGDQQSALFGQRAFGVGRYHIIRAALDAIVYQVNDIVTAMEQDAKNPVGTLRVDGGASVNNYLVKTQADISNTRVVRPACVETTALGAAYLAGLATGFWADESDLGSGAGETVFHPEMSDAERDERIKGWKEAVKTLL